IIIPTYKGRRGHPVVFSRYLLPEILSAPPDQGARAVVRAHPDQVFEIETDEEGVVTDIDTLEDYYNFLARLGGKESRGPDFLIEIGRI
ncbi:MAG: NTP transferase domain-containing protein, partial [candidate division NC10 bacterium]|nr:NTP transferase domain-containing protein [candidate division NC10 bacterium]